MSNNLNLYIPINSLGFGLFSLGYLKILLESSSINIALKDISLQKNKDYTQAINDFELNEKDFYKCLKRDFFSNAKTFIIWHPGAIYKYIYKNKCENIGFTHFETTKLNQSDIKIIQNKDNSSSFLSMSHYFYSSIFC